MNNRSRAHGARLNCNKELAVTQTMVTDVRTRLAQSHDFSMRTGIGIFNIAIPAAAYDVSVLDNQRPHRHFSGFQSTLCQSESLSHEKLVGWQVTNLGW